MTDHWTNNALVMVDVLVDTLRDHSLIWEVVHQVDPLAEDYYSQRQQLISAVESLVETGPIKVKHVISFIDQLMGYIFTTFVELPITDGLEEAYPVYVLSRYSGLDREVLCKFLQGSQVLAKSCTSRSDPRPHFPYSSLVAEAEMVQVDRIDPDDYQSVRDYIGQGSPRYLTNTLFAMVALMSKNPESPSCEYSKDQDLEETDSPCLTEVRKYLDSPYIQYMILITDACTVMD